jgi:hypothetical protein
VTETPYISGDTATFLWQGASPPELIGDFNGWDRSRAPVFDRDGPERWMVHIRLPSDAYIEYIYLLDGEHTLDPANPRRVSNGFHKYNNYFYMPGAAATPWAQRQPKVPRGLVSQYELPAFPAFLQSA